MRVVHYLNQFFAGAGGEDRAADPPAVADGPIGPGRRLAALLGEDLLIVATVWCGDDHAASNLGAAADIVALAREAGAEMVLCGPAFGSGRYGIASARVAALAARAGLPAVASLDPDNPGLPEVAPAIAVDSGPTSRHMQRALANLASAARSLAAGELPVEVGSDGGIRISKPARRNRVAQANAAQRAVTLALARLGGEPSASEIPLSGFGTVAPAGPVEDPAHAVVALLTEGAVVPAGNPDRLESARAKRWLRYSLEGLEELGSGAFQSVHGGFSTVAANADPHRIVPLDEARALEREGMVGRLHSEYLVTAGNGTAVADAARFGTEWAAELHKAGVQAAILTAT